MSDNCVVCGLPFDSGKVMKTESGICTFCDYFKSSNRDLFDFKKNKNLFEERIERVRGKYQYDALVGISGGKDGVYVLHKLVREYQLKVLVITYDNEFFSCDVKDSIKEIIDKYNVDHFFYTSNNLKTMYRGIMRSIGIPCFACATAGYYLVMKILNEKRIPLFVHGRSPFQMIRSLDKQSFDSDLFFALIKSNLNRYNPHKIKEIYNKSYEFLKVLIHSLKLEDSEKMGIMEEFFEPLLMIKDDFVPESYAYFLTEDYNENNIRKLLRDEADYIAPSSHSDCEIHNAANYLTAIPEGISVDVLEAAVMRRKNMISSTEFDELLTSKIQEINQPSPVILDELKLLCDRININTDEIEILNHAAVELSVQ